jgi:hypothetical protein
MRLENAAQKGLRLGRQVVGPLEPQNHRLPPTPPYMEFLTALSESPVLAARTGQKLLALLKAIGGDPVALAGTRRPCNNKGAVHRVLP